MRLPPRVACTGLLVRVLAAMAVLAKAEFDDSSLQSRPAGAAKSSPGVHPALRCGGSGDVATDSNDVISLISFATTVCCDQQGESLSTSSGNLKVPSTCKTPGAAAAYPCTLILGSSFLMRRVIAVAGCAHAVGFVSNACTDSNGKWNDGFLGAAFGPLVDDIFRLCNAHSDPSTDDSVIAISAKHVDADAACKDGQNARPDCLLLESHEVLPMYIVDSADELDGEIDCHTCGLERTSVQSCIASCNAHMQADQETTVLADGTVGNSCSPKTPCGNGAYCDYNLGYGSYPQCKPCSDCAPSKWGDGLSHTDQLFLRAAGKLTIQVTIQVLYLPDHSQLLINGEQPGSTSSNATPIVFQGKQLPSASSRVINVNEGQVRIRLRSDIRDVGKPAALLLKVDLLCTKSAACGAHGQCGDDRKCSCEYGWVGHACDERIA